MSAIYVRLKWEKCEMSDCEGLAAYLSKMHTNKLKSHIYCKIDLLKRGEILLVSSQS